MEINDKVSFEDLFLSTTGVDFSVEKSSNKLIDLDTFLVIELNRESSPYRVAIVQLSGVIYYSTMTFDNCLRQSRNALLRQEIDLFEANNLVQFSSHQRPDSGFQIAVALHYLGPINRGDSNKKSTYDFSSKNELSLSFSYSPNELLVETLAYDYRCMNQVKVNFEPFSDWQKKQLRVSPSIK